VFRLFGRWERRLDMLENALKAHVSASISRLDSVEKQQKELATTICHHKDQNALQLERIGKVVDDLKKSVEGDYRLKIMKAVTALVITLTVGVIVWRRPDSLPYIARIVESAMSHTSPGRQM
jgi:hypothetical protein